MKRTDLHKRHEDPAIDRKIRASLRYAIGDAATFSVMIGMAESYFQAFAVFLRATVFEVGVLYTVPMFLASVVQLFSWQRVRILFQIVNYKIRWYPGISKLCLIF